MLFRVSLTILLYVLGRALSGREEDSPVSGEQRPSDV